MAFEKGTAMKLPIPFVAQPPPIQMDDTGVLRVGERASGWRRLSTPSIAVVLPKRFCSNIPHLTWPTFTPSSRTICGLAKRSMPIGRNVAAKRSNCL